MIKRILLVNKFYYPSGGYCVVTLNTQSLLRCRGHEVGVFSMKYPENIESEWSKYFAGEVNFSGGHEKKNGCREAHAGHERCNRDAYSKN